MNLTIIGLGLIGGSLALDLRERGFSDKITGIDHLEKHQKEALSLGLVDLIQELPQALEKADLVILSVPVDVIERILPQILDLISSQTTVVDMGSTKKRIADAIVHHSKRKQFVASHPMAGTENSGPSSAIRGLFDHKTTVICDAEKSDSFHHDRVIEMYKALKMRIIEMSSDEHDVHAAYVSHLSHISSFVLANTVLSKEKNTRTVFDMAGGGFESTVRLAKSSPAMWNPIFYQNKENVLLALDSYIEQMGLFRESLLNSNEKKTRDLMINANQIRKVLESISGRNK